jgi:DNA recombination-dependent growth factor C
MGIMSSNVSLTRYQVDGKLAESVIETVAAGLKQNTIIEIDDEDTEKSVGWTSFDAPYRPNFEGSSFVVGPLFVFSLRIDKKNVSTKIINKRYSIEMARKLAESGREYLSREEKKLIKDAVVHALLARIPATPAVYDVLWNYEDGQLWFFSNQKAANEALETLFSKSFRLTLIRLFPYTAATLTAGLSDAQRDALSGLSPTRFTE